MKSLPVIARAISCAAWLATIAGCADEPATAPGQPTPTPPPHTWQDMGLTNSYATVHALASYQGQLVAGGDFLDVAGDPAPSLVRRAGSGWALLGPQSNGDVLALTVHDGRLIAGGSFTRMGADSMGHVAAWDGSAWDDLGGGTDWTVLALASHGDDLVAAGVFLSAGGTPAKFMARWDGVAWHPLGSGMDDVVLALAVYRGELIAGGNFTTAGGTSARYIAAWNGTDWRPLGSETALNGSVRSLFVHHDTLFVGGSFDMAGGVPAKHVACWNGTQWDSLSAGLGTYANQGVHAFTAYQDHVIAGGAFSGGVKEWKAAYWFPLSTLFGDVLALTVHNGELIAGGYIQRVGNGPYAIARWVD